MFTNSLFYLFFNLAVKYVFMISVDETYRFIDTYKKTYGTEMVPLLSSLNRTLAVDVKADRDFPPFDRVTMDGIAINSQAFANGRRTFRVVSISAAGSVAQTLHHTDDCVEVMTGTLLPLNADVVIPYEQCDVKDGIANVTIEEIQPFQNIHQKGTDEKEGNVLVRDKTRISPAHISVMATVGMKEVAVYKLPSVAVCSTGDELVKIDEEPLPHQIRQSNVYLLMADLETEKIKADIYHLRDNKEDMKRMLQDILQQHNVLLLSGAVSKGKYDFLPDVLAELGMVTIFHRVAQRPGKPFLFGAIGEKLIFGFPGNPVSTFVCYHLYCKYWLCQCMYQPVKKLSAKLSVDINLSSPLTNHVLVKIDYKEGECLAEPIAFSTSGDIPSLLNADGIISLPSRKEGFQKEDVVEVIPCR